jgi:hypothetical protein
MTAVLRPVCDTLMAALDPATPSIGAFYGLKDAGLSCTFTIARPGLRHVRGRKDAVRGPWIVTVDIEAGPDEAIVWLARDRHRASKLRYPDRASLERVVDRLYAWARRKHAHWTAILDLDRQITVGMTTNGERFGAALSREIDRTERPLDYDMMTTEDAFGWLEWIELQRRAGAMNRDKLSGKGGHE